MNNKIKEFIAQKNIAVIGSFRSSEKIAYRVLLKLVERGYNVFPINPSLAEVEGLKCYKSVIDVPVDIDAVDLVTPPEATEKVVEDCKRKSVKFIWMQPGAESGKAIKFCEDNNIKLIHDMCLLVELD